MSKFRTKPVIVEAEQWDGTIHPDVDILGSGRPAVWNQRFCSYTPLAPGDWIVTAPDGQRSVCADDEFAATYEPVEEERR